MIVEAKPPHAEREDYGKRGPKGYDAGKKVKGRKRHLIVDTMGLIMTVWVTSAGLQDYEQATNSSESMIYIAMINLMLHRLRPG